MSLFNRATALDTYIGRIVASLVTAFTKNERDTHIVGRSVAVAKFKHEKITKPGHGFTYVNPAHELFLLIH